MFEQSFAWGILLFGAFQLWLGFFSKPATPGRRPGEPIITPPPRPGSNQIPAATASAPPPAPEPVSGPAPGPVPAPAPAPATAPEPAATRTRAPLPRRPRPRPERATWRTFARAPQGFDADLKAGDYALSLGELRKAASVWLDALAIAERDRETGRLYFITEAILRLNALACFCLTPPDGLHLAGDAERWAALRELATRNFLGDYRAAVLRLGSMLYRLHRNRPHLAPEGERAWDVLMLCRDLPAPALEFLDDRLIEEGLWSLRPRLATHPAATRDLWLAQLERGRTPDLVHTIWEIAGAAEDAEVKAALTGQHS